MRPIPTSSPPLLQAFLLWLCTFNVNDITSLVLFSLSILFWCLAASNFYPGITKGLGAYGFFVAFLTIYGELLPTPGLALRATSAQPHAALTQPAVALGHRLALAPPACWHSIKLKNSPVVPALPTWR